MASRTKPLLVVMVALLMSLNALAIDGMLPALDEMATQLGAASGNQRQLVVSAYMLANGFGCLVAQILPDRISGYAELFGNCANAVALRVQYMYFH